MKSILSTLILFMGLSAYGEVGPWPFRLETSSHTPHVFETLKIKAHTGLNQGQAAMIFGSRPDENWDKEKLPESVLASAVVNIPKTGVVEFTYEIPVWMKNKEFYVQVWARRDKSAPVKYSMQLGHQVRPWEKFEWDYKVWPDRWENRKTGEVKFAKYPGREAYLEANKQRGLDGKGKVVWFQDAQNHVHWSMNMDPTPCTNEELDPNKRIWMIGNVDDPSKVRTLNNPVGGSDSVRYRNNVCGVHAAGHTIKCDDRACLLSDVRRWLRDVGFHSSVMDGEYDWYTKSGNDAKWGVLIYDVDGDACGGLEKGCGGAVFRDMTIKNIKREHAFYLHNTHGDIALEHIKALRVGRTCVQMHNRSGESQTYPPGCDADKGECKGWPGSGHTRIYDFKCEDSQIGDNVAGGSGFTFAGRNQGTVTLDLIHYVAGYDDKLNDAINKGEPVGTGSFVAYLGGGSDDEPTKEIKINHMMSSIRAPGSDRGMFQVNNKNPVEKLSVRNMRSLQGRRECISIPDTEKKRLSFDDSSECGGASTKVLYNGNIFRTYEDFLKNVNAQTVSK